MSAICKRCRMEPAAICVKCAGEIILDDSGISQGARDVFAERRRQIEEEGFTAEHDEQWGGSELVHAAICYLDSERGIIRDQYWPWNPTWWKPKDRRRNLLRAAALIIAEIDRLDRLAGEDQEDDIYS